MIFTINTCAKSNRTMTYCTLERKRRKWVLRGRKEIGDDLSEDEREIDWGAECKWRERTLLAFIDLVSLYFCGNKEFLVRREKRAERKSKHERVGTESQSIREKQRAPAIFDCCWNIGICRLWCLVMKFKPCSLRLIL